MEQGLRGYQTYCCF